MCLCSSASSRKQRKSAALRRYSGKELADIQNDGAIVGSVVCPAAEIAKDGFCRIGDENRHVTPSASYCDLIPAL